MCSSFQKEDLYSTLTGSSSFRFDKSTISFCFLFSALFFAFTAIIAIALHIKLQKKTLQRSSLAFITCPL